MHKNKLILMIAVMFIIVLGSASVLYAKLGSSVERETIVTEQTTETKEEVKEETNEEVNEEVNEETPVKTNAPDFTVEDKDGNKVKLSDFYGKPVVINFWASWCGTCTAEMPEFEQAYKTYGDEVEFMMINVTEGSRETLASAKEFLAGKDYTFPVYFDTTLAASISYKASALPVTYFIDAEGNAVAKAASYTKLETIEKGIDLIK